MKITESQLRKIISESIINILSEDAWDYDSSAPWNEPRYADEDDYLEAKAEAEREEIQDRIDNGYYDGYEVMDDSGNILGQFKTFDEAKDFCINNVDTEMEEFSIYGLIDGYTSQELFDDFNYDYIWSTNEMGNEYSQVAESK